MANNAGVVAATARLVDSFSVAGRWVTRLSRGQILLMIALATLTLLLGFALHNLADTGPRSGPAAISDGSPDTSSRILAYVAADELALVVDGRVVARVGGDFRRAAPGWTADGRYVFALAAGTKDSAITVIDRETLDTFTVPCPRCGSVAPIGGDDVILVDGTRRIHRLDLARGSAAQPVAVDLPISFSQQLTAVAGLPQVTLFAGADRDTTTRYGGPEDLLLAHADGRIERIGRTNSALAVFGGTAASSTGYGGARMAYVGGGHFNACRTTASITVLDPATGSTQSTFHVPGPEWSAPYGTEGHGSRVLDLWWGEDRLLYATTQAWYCENGFHQVLDEPILRRLEPDGSWATVKGQLPTRSVRARSGRAFANLAPIVDEHGYAPLIWYSGPDQTVINPKVLAIATPPPGPPAR